MSFIALGASNAIFGGFGLISQETKKYNIKAWIIILILTFTIFINPITGFFSYGIGNEKFILDFKQSIAHFSGFVFGIGFFFLLGKIKPILTMRKRYILRGGL
jgi:membrane associated rhomboid family serine protease